MKLSMDKFKDLQIGDQVSFSDIYVHDKLRASGQGLDRLIENMPQEAWIQ